MIFALQVTDISDYNDARSLEKMWDQVNGVYSKMKPVMDAAEDGVNLICYSQGNKSVVHIYIYLIWNI